MTLWDNSVTPFFSRGLYDTGKSVTLLQGPWMFQSLNRKHPGKKWQNQDSNSGLPDSSMRVIYTKLAQPRLLWFQILIFLVTPWVPKHLCLCSRCSLCWGFFLCPSYPDSCPWKSPFTWSFLDPSEFIVLYISVSLPWWLSGEEPTCKAGDAGLIPGSERSPGEGNGNSLQYSCLENPMDREDWLATIHGVSKESNVT